MKTHHKNKFKRQIIKPNTDGVQAGKRNACQENSADGVQAGKRNACQHEADTVHTLRYKEGERHSAAKPRPKVGLTDTGYTGGRNKAANSGTRKIPNRTVYDPLLGKHTIPVVAAPDLLEQIVADGNFMTALQKVNSAPYKATGCDHRTVREVC